MNYQHFYHAGSPADVFKHIVLCVLLEHFKQKAKPFCYIDTHAAYGNYDLIHSKNSEYLLGIDLLKQKSSQQSPHSAIIQDYLSLQENFTQFKGSPQIAEFYLRNEDDMILIEKADEPFDVLKRHFGRNQQAHCHHQDARIALKALLPPKIKRGLVFIDPAYEENNEHEIWLEAIKSALAKFPTACYALWFPIKSINTIQYFYQKIKSRLPDPNMTKIILEFCPLPPDVSLRLNGSGLLLINPPYQFEKTIKPVLKELHSYLAQHPKSHTDLFTL